MLWLELLLDLKIYILVYLHILYNLTNFEHAKQKMILKNRK